MTIPLAKRDASPLRDIGLALATTVLTSAGRALWRASSLRTRAVLGAGMLAGTVVVLLSRKAREAASRRVSRRARRDEEIRLDEAIEETFPAGDPV